MNRCCFAWLITLCSTLAYASEPAKISYEEEYRSCLQARKTAQHPQELINLLNRITLLADHQTSRKTRTSFRMLAERTLKKLEKIWSAEKNTLEAETRVVLSKKTALVNEYKTARTILLQNLKNLDRSFTSSLRGYQSEKSILEAQQRALISQAYRIKKEKPSSTIVLPETSLDDEALSSFNDLKKLFTKLNAS